MKTHNVRGPQLLAVCADDFGLSQAVSAAFVHLAQGQRINAVPCVTDAPY